MLRKSGNRIIIGYDLADTSSQISYCYIKEEASVETVASVAGTEIYDIPTVLCKRAGVNQWLFGKEAVRFVQDNPDEGILVDGLVEKALSGEMVSVDEEEYHPIALLTLFMKRSLGMLSEVASLSQIAAIMVTTYQMDGRMKEVLSKVGEKLGLKDVPVHFQSYTESFYYYMLYQPKELWAYQTLLLDYRTKKIGAYKMECNKRTTPVVVYIQQKEHAFDGTDDGLLQIAKRYCTEQVISSVYLIGEGFRGDWMEESLRYLCRGRRVFQGNNLYSKGAALAMLERFLGSKDAGEYIYLGNDKLKANIGMKLLQGGEMVYLAMLDAGNNWYETGFEGDIYLKGDNELEITVTPLQGSGEQILPITLDGITLEQEQLTRVRLKLYMISEEVLCLEAADLGFGRLFEGSGTVFRKEITIY